MTALCFAFVQTFSVFKNTGILRQAQNDNDCVRMTMTAFRMTTVVQNRIASPTARDGGRVFLTFFREGKANIQSSGNFFCRVAGDENYTIADTLLQ